MKPEEVRVNKFITMVRELRQRQRAFHRTLPGSEQRFETMQAIDALNKKVDELLEEFAIIQNQMF